MCFFVILTKKCSAKLQNVQDPKKLFVEFDHDRIFYWSRCRQNEFYLDKKIGASGCKVSYTDLYVSAYLFPFQKQAHQLA
jgi:hypothetical protein